MIVTDFKEIDEDDLDLTTPTVVDGLDHERYTAFMNSYKELQDWVYNRAKLIANRRWPKHRTWVDEFDQYAVVMEYNDACHCHPSYAKLSFPTDWLFAENCEALVDAELAKEQKKATDIKAANDAIREKQEREDLAKLQAKYGK